MLPNRADAHGSEDDVVWDDADTVVPRASRGLCVVCGGVWPCRTCRLGEQVLGFVQ